MACRSSLGPWDAVRAVEHPATLPGLRVILPSFLRPQQMTVRVQGPHEHGRFSPEAWGLLLALRGSGALDGAELEQVIERALAHFDGRIALDELRSLLDGAGLDDGGASAGRVH